MEEIGIVLCLVDVTSTMLTATGHLTLNRLFDTALQIEKVLHVGAEQVSVSTLVWHPLDLLLA